MPTGRPFPKGVSGNPGGRPRVPPHVIELARAATEEAINTLVAALRCRDVGARIRAATILLDRAWGRPPPMLEAVAVGGDKARPKGLSRKTVEQIRAKILGLAPDEVDPKETKLVTEVVFVKPDGTVGDGFGDPAASKDGGFKTEA